MSQNVLSRQTMQYLPVKLYWLGELKASKERTLSALAILRNSDSKEPHSLANRDREAPVAHRRRQSVLGEWPRPPKWVNYRARGRFNVLTQAGTIPDISHRYCRIIQRADGYSYQPGTTAIHPSPKGDGSLA
jgi:hypothetical protein